MLVLAAANQQLHPRFGPTLGISCGYKLPSTELLIGSGWPNPSGLQPGPVFNLDSSTLWTVALVGVSAEGKIWIIERAKVCTTAVRIVERTALQADAANRAK